MSNYLRCKVFFGGKPPEETDSYSRDRKENDNSIYDNNDGDTCNSKKKTTNTSHNIDMNNDNL